MTGRLVDRLRGTPILNLADQLLSSGTNFLAAVIVAHKATPEQFGLFSIVLVTFFLAAGFNRAVPHAIAMTMEWDDERARSGYFFLPPLVVGFVATIVLVVFFLIIDPAWLALPLLLLPMLLQDAVRMHAFAVQKPQVALLSDAAWLVVVAASIPFVATAAGAAAAWGVGGLVALLVTRPLRIRVRVQRRPIRANVVSAALEFVTLAGLGYLTPLLASPIITILGVGALQGANVIRGPVILILQGLLFHRMAGPPITSETCVREALKLSRMMLVGTLICVPPLFLLRSFYGPRLLGATWPQVEPLVLPTLLTMIAGSVAFGPATVVRKMGRFALSAKLQGAHAPMFVGFPLIGAAVAGTEGFVWATALAYAVFNTTWWIVLPKVAASSAAPADAATA